MVAGIGLGPNADPVTRANYYADLGGTINNSSSSGASSAPEPSDLEQAMAEYDATEAVKGVAKRYHIFDNSKGITPDYEGTLMTIEQSEDKEYQKDAHVIDYIMTNYFGREFTAQPALNLVFWESLGLESFITPGKRLLADFHNKRDDLVKSLRKITCYVKDLNNSREEVLKDQERVIYLIKANARIKSVFEAYTALEKKYLETVEKLE